jgi:hypothetical protein
MLNRRDPLVQRGPTPAQLEALLFLTGCIRYHTRHEREAFKQRAFPTPASRPQASHAPDDHIYKK